MDTKQKSPDLIGHVNAGGDSDMRLADEGKMEGPVAHKRRRYFEFPFGNGDMEGGVGDAGRMQLG